MRLDKVLCRKLFYGDFIHAILVTATLEIGIEEGGNDSTSRVGRDKSSGHHTHIGIVVLTCQGGNLLNPAQRRAYALVLVERNIYTITATTHSYTGIALPRFHSHSKGVGIVGIVSTCRGIGSKIDIRHTHFIE